MRPRFVVENRKIYGAFIENTPRPKVEDLFNEEFNSNAFDEDDGDGMSEADDEEDSGEDDEKTYLRPSKQIQKVHSGTTSRIEAFSNDFEGATSEGALHCISLCSICPITFKFRGTTVMAGIR
ncbi:hypothetical protein ANO14919_091390 [Xylariales sp. No.14919]|nr:hypothetical protein ANO14919_091390 [Xylariales sp. No.14919]